MVDRLGKHQNDAGLYARPKAMQVEEASKDEKKCDMVEALLANEAQRKKEKELLGQQEEALAQKRKEIKSLSIEDLKKRLAKKGLDASGKKEDMVEALFLAAVQEEVVAARQSELKSKSLQELKEIACRQGLESGTKEHMVK